MVKIESNDKLDEYVEKYELRNLFSNDMEEYMTLQDLCSWCK